jgi:hypothetical protein
MMRASLARLGLSTTAKAFAPIVPPDPVLVRTYKGSLVYLSSGSVTKAGIAAQGFISGVNSAMVEVDVEAVGGGQAGKRTSTSPDTGGVPAAVNLVTVAWADLPSEIAFTVGAGGAGASAAVGGTSSVAGIVSAAGGSGPPLSPKDRPTGPGQGGLETNSLEAARGGRSNASIPELMLEGGKSTSTNVPAQGLDATSPFQHGSGASAFGGGFTGLRGGIPGGGGGRTWTAPGSSVSPGGQGAVRFHVYAWEPST